MDEQLKRTPLYDEHVALGARMVPFGGWEMPVQYRGIMEEHRAVREEVGLFDVSHMGQFSFEGAEAAPFLDALTANDVRALKVGDAQYSMLLNEAGGTIDDIIVYRIADAHYMMVVNAGNLDKDWAHVSAQARGWAGVRAANQSDEWALLALQGPRAEALLNDLVPDDLATSAIPYYGVVESTIEGVPVIIARTGYTGEDGFELFVPNALAAPTWRRLLGAGATPAGLGARDTLRLEASMPLYGHELDDETSPLEAGLGFFVKKEGDYLGAERQRALRRDGLPRRLVMLKVTGRGIPREGYEVQDAEGNTIGRVTSGTMSPTLGHAIAQGYVDPAHAAVGTPLAIFVRGRTVAAEVVKRPFYKRKA